MKTYKKLYWGHAWDANKGTSVIATSAREARKFYASLKGYYAIDVNVERICRLPPQHQSTIEIYPSDNTLIDCGCKFVNHFCSTDKIILVIKRMLKLDNGRIFYYNNRIFQESILK